MSCIVNFLTFLCLFCIFHNFISLDSILDIFRSIFPFLDSFFSYVYSSAYSNHRIFCYTILIFFLFANLFGCYLLSLIFLIFSSFYFMSLNILNVIFYFMLNNSIFKVSVSLILPSVSVEPNLWRLFSL